MIRDSRHSPNGRDTQWLGAEPEWRGAVGNRPHFDTFLDTLARPTPAQEFVLRAGEQLRAERGE